MLAHQNERVKSRTTVAPVRYSRFANRWIYRAWQISREHTENTGEHLAWYEVLAKARAEEVPA